MDASRRAPFRISVVAALGLLIFVPKGQAQVAAAPLGTESSSGWTVAIAPYVWLPALRATYSLNGPLGTTVTDSTDVGFGDYLSQLNFALMGGAQVRHDRFTLMTDLIYANASITSSNSQFSTVNLGGRSIDIPLTQQISTGTRLASTIWSVEGGYTLFRGEWGNLDTVGGLRMLFFNSTSNYSLSSDIAGPNQTIALSRDGSISLGKSYVEGVGGIMGRINMPHSKFYMPFYLDAGGGSVPFTWQIYAALAYQATSWLDLSLGYRYLGFNGGSKTSGVEALSMRGMLFVSNIRF
jgi:hypothetical protein